MDLKEIGCEDAEIIPQLHVRLRWIMKRGTDTQQHESQKTKSVSRYKKNWSFVMELLNIKKNI
jgi:hypothetical protein